jgi:hypothetical protein
MGNKCDNHEEINTFSSLLVAQTFVGFLLMLITSLDLLSKALLVQVSTNVFFRVNNASYSVSVVPVCLFIYCVISAGVPRKT